VVVPLSRAVALVALAATTAVGPLFAQKPASASPGLALPKSARKALDRQFKHWEVAPVDPEATACRRDGAGESPTFVQADFDSDGQQDVAIAVKVGDEVRLIAILARLEDTKLVDVDSLGHGGADAYLGIEKRGTKFKRQNIALDDYYPADTLAVYRCGQPTTAYFWAGSGFNKVVIP
jgi:hypothetical protein